MKTTTVKVFEYRALNLNGCGRRDIKIIPQKVETRLNDSIKMGFVMLSACLSAGASDCVTYCTTLQLNFVALSHFGDRKNTVWTVMVFSSIDFDFDFPPLKAITTRKSVHLQRMTLDDFAIAIIITSLVSRSCAIKAHDVSL